jgi:hypothetical protein
MRKSTYYKILLTPIAALILGACSSKLHNQSQEYDDIYFTKADRNKATVAEDTAPQTSNTSNEELPIINKTYSSEEYSPQYVDPALVEKFNNTNAFSAEARAGLMVTNVNYLSYNSFVSDFEQNYTEFQDLPLDWGKGYWSEVQFDNRVATDYQFRNAWYNYYYNGYEGSLNNYFEQASARQNYAANNNFYSPTSFRPRVSLSFGIGGGYGYMNDPFYRPFYNPYQDPFYNPYFYSAVPYYAYTNPLFTSVNFYFGSSYWCPPNYRNGPSYSNRPSNSNNYPYYPSTPGNPNNESITDDRDVSRGPRNSRRIFASVQDDVSKGTSPGTRSEANYDSPTVNANNPVSSYGNYARATTSRTITSGRINKNRVDDIDNVRNVNNPFASTSTSAVTVNSRNSRIPSDDFSFSPSTKTRTSSNLRSRTSNAYTQPSKNNFNRTSRQPNSGTTFSRINYGTSKSSRNNFSRPTTTRPSSNFNKSSGSRSSGSMVSPPKSSYSPPVKKSSTSTRSTTTRSTGSKSTGSSKNSGRSNE